MQLSIQSIIVQALDSIKANLNFFLALALLFFVLNAMVELIIFGLSISSFLPLLILSAISLALYAKQAVVVHRTVILHEGNQWDKVFSWGQAENGFFLICVLLWIAMSIAVALIALILIPLMYAGASSGEDHKYLLVFTSVAIIICGMVFSRICLMLPSRAIDQPISIEDSVNKTKAQNFKIFTLVVLLPIATNISLGYFIKEDHLLINLFISLIAHVLVVFQVSILSHTYLALVGLPKSEAEERLDV